MSKDKIIKKTTAIIAQLHKEAQKGKVREIYYVAIKDDDVETGVNGTSPFLAIGHLQRIMHCLLETIAERARNKKP